MSEIVEAKQIGSFKIGMSLDTLMRKLKDVSIEHIEVQNIYLATLITCLPYRFWVADDSKEITQITVSSGYDGKFLNVIGIGSKMRDIQSVAGDFYSDQDVYKLKNYKGICFELGDTDEDDSWDELDAPVEYISVYFEN